MPLRTVLPLSIVLLLATVVLAACGGGGDSDDSTAAGPASSRQTAPTAPGGEGRPGEDRDAEGAAASGGGAGNRGGGAEDRAGASGEREAPVLATDPGSIRGARVTAAGAVQTLPPDEAARQEAMENSYSSIKTFGEEVEGGEATDITFALVQYLDAKAAGDWATACARLYSVLRANLEKDGRSCADVYGALLSRAPAAARAEAARIDVASVRRGEGNRAFVIYKSPATLSADMPMYLEGDMWTVGALDAYVLTPEQLEAGR